MEPVKLKDGHRPCTAFAPFECCEAAITCQTHLAICIWDLLVGRPGDAHGTNEIPKQDLNWGGGRGVRYLYLGLLLNATHSLQPAYLPPHFSCPHFYPYPLHMYEALMPQQDMQTKGGCDD